MDLSDAKELATNLMAAHKLDGWVFGWDNAKQRFGCCHYRDKRISLSRLLVSMNDEEEVMDVILHEIAHAKAGLGTGHSATWKRVARDIGCRGTTCYDHYLVERPLSKWVGECPNCGHETEVDRLSKQRKRSACAPCCREYNYGEYSPEFLIEWRER